MKMSDITCLIITNQESLGFSLTQTAQTALGENATVAAITYAESIALLTPERIEEADFLMLELFRNYPGGLRAEGIVLAERLLYQKMFLIISPLHLAHQIQCPGYWDVEATDKLIERVKSIIAMSESSSDNFEILKRKFIAMLDLPPQHRFTK